MTTGVPEITPADLNAALESGDPIEILDVREPDEWRICRIAGSRHVPLSQLAGRLEEVPRDADTVVVCHHGTRSAYVVARLRERGWDRLSNLRGGLDAWAREVDPTMPTY